MNDSRSSLEVTAGRARRRFPDYQLDAVYSVCWPVYRVRLTVTVLEAGELSTTAHYILKLVNLDISEPAKLARLLGLPDSYVVGAAAELMRDELVEQEADLRLAITRRGKNVLDNNGQAMRPQTRQLEVPFDPLTRRVLDMDPGDLLNQDNVRKDGLFLVQYVGAKPSPSDLHIEEIKAYNSHSGPDDRIEEDIIDVSEISNRSSRLQYREDIVVAKLDNPATGEPTFAAYCGHQYLEEETTMLRRLAERGVNLVPGEFEKGAHRSWDMVPSASPEEVALLNAIERLDIAASGLDHASVGAEADQEATQDVQQRDGDAERILKPELEWLRLSKQVAEMAAELNNRTGGSLCTVTTEEHHPLLLKAIDQAKEELTLVSAWINAYAFDHEVRNKIASAVKRGVVVRIAWGFGVERRGPEPERNLKNGEDALARLKRLIPTDALERLMVKRIETHEKFIICDDQFAALGSLNWLSYRGNMDKGYRREASIYSTRPDFINLLKEIATTIFQSS